MGKENKNVDFFFFIFLWALLLIPLVVRKKIRIQFQKISEAKFDDAKRVTISTMDKRINPNASHVLKTIEREDSRCFSAICNSDEERTCSHCVDTDIMIRWLEQKNRKANLCIQCEFDKSCD